MATLWPQDPSAAPLTGCMAGDAAQVLMPRFEPLGYLQLFRGKVGPSRIRMRGLSADVVEAMLSGGSFRAGGGRTNIDGSPMVSCVYIATR